MLQKPLVRTIPEIFVRNVLIFLSALDHLLARSRNISVETFDKQLTYFIVLALVRVLRML